MNPPSATTAYIPKDGEQASPPLPAPEGKIGILTHIDGADTDAILSMCTEEEKSAISKTEIRNKKTAVLHFVSKDACEMFEKKSKEKLLNGKKFQFSCF